MRTHSALLKGSHTAAHRAKHGAIRMGALSLPSERSARSQTSPGRVYSRRTQRAFGTAMRLCVSLFRGVAAPLGCVIFFQFCRNCDLYAMRACARQGGYHHSRRALHVVETPDARLSKRLICYFLGLTDSSLIPAAQNIIPFSLQIPEEPAGDPLVLSLLSVFPLLALIGPIEERNDLGAGAACVGAEGGSGRAVGHAVLHGPGHCLSAESVGGHVGEAVHRSGSGAHRTVQEGHALAASAGAVDAEGAVSQTIGDAVFQRPSHRVIAVAAGEHVGGNRGRALGSGRTGRTPQEGHDLATGAGIVGAEQAVGLAVGDALLHSPFHCLGIVCVGGNVREGGGSLDFRKLSGDGDLAVGHGEGVLAVLFGELHLAALLIQNLDGIQLIALVGLHGDGHGVAAAGVLGRNGDGAVFGLIRGDGVRWLTGTRRPMP